MNAWGGAPEAVTVADLEPGEGEVLVRVAACGVGMTVLNCIRGDLGNDPSNLPLVPGHELVGSITKTGPGVDPRREGELVTAYFYLSCGRCDMCLAGTEDLCLDFGGYLGVNRDGGYAEYAVLPDRNAIPLPEGSDPVLSTTVPDAVATPVHVARRANVTPGKRVAVIGAGGGVGIHMVQVARAYGADVVGLDVVTTKLDYLTRELNVRAVDFSRPEGVDRRQMGFGADPDVIVDFIGSAATQRWAIEHLGVGGRLVALTTFPAVDYRLSPREIVLGELSILGSRYATRYELRLAAQLVRSGAVQAVVGRREGPERLAEIHDDLVQGRLLGRGALVW